MDIYHMSQVVHFSSTSGRQTVINKKKEIYLIRVKSVDNITRWPIIEVSDQQWKTRRKIQPFLPLLAEIFVNSGSIHGAVVIARYPGILCTSSFLSTKHKMILSYATSKTPTTLFQASNKKTTSTWPKCCVLLLLHYEKKIYFYLNGAMYKITANLKIDGRNPRCEPPKTPWRV